MGLLATSFLKPCSTSFVSCEIMDLRLYFWILVFLSNTLTNRERNFPHSQLPGELSTPNLITNPVIIQNDLHVKFLDSITWQYQSLNINNTRVFTNLSYKNSLKSINNSTYRNISRLLILAIAGDIQMNPGPRIPKYPCAICRKACTWKTRAIQCDDCDNWHHAQCVDMNSHVYSALDSPDMSWHCFACGIPQFSSSLFSSFSRNDHSRTSTSSSNSSTLSQNTGSPIFDKNRMCTSSPIPNPRTKIDCQLATQQNVNLLIINFQSVLSKADEFAVLIETQDPDIVIGSESWLKKGKHTDAEVLPNSFIIYRNDRKDGYGGVFVAVNKRVSSYRLTPEYNEIEYVAVKINLFRQPPLIINAAYRPPKSKLEHMEKLCTEVENIYSKHKNATF